MHQGESRTSGRLSLLLTALLVHTPSREARMLWYWTDPTYVESILRTRKQLDTDCTVNDSSGLVYFSTLRCTIATAQ